MDKALADISILWRNVGPFHDLSKVLIPEHDLSKSRYTDFIQKKNRNYKSNGSRCGIIDDICENAEENEVIKRIESLNAKWKRLFYDAEDRSEDLLKLYEDTLKDISDLSANMVNYRHNFNRINQKFNDMASRKRAIGEKIALLEDMYSHYNRYWTFDRTLDRIENNEFIRLDHDDISGDVSSTIEGNLEKMLGYVDQIAKKLNDMLPRIDESIDFFTVHPDYYDSETFWRKYDSQKSRIFSLIKLVFKEIYSFVGLQSKSYTNFDIYEHYNKYRKIGRVIRNLTLYYNENQTETNKAELLQLQMYYITNRVKILNPIMNSKINNFDNFANVTSFFISVCNLEILTFRDTFANDGTQDSLGTMVSNVVFYFLQASKKHIENLSNSWEMRKAMETIEDNLIDRIQCSDNANVLRSLLTKAQYIYQTIEAMLIKAVQREIITYIKKFDKCSYTKLYSENFHMKYDWEDPILATASDKFKYIKYLNLYPPVCYAIGIVTMNMGFLNHQNLTRVATEILDAVKVSILDMHHSIGKLGIVGRTLQRINQQMFLVRNLHVLLHCFCQFNELDIFINLSDLIEQNECQLTSNIVSVIAQEFIEFSHKQRVHDEAMYKEEISRLNTRLEEEIPKLHQIFRFQLAEIDKKQEDLLSAVFQGVREVIRQYETKFNLEGADTLEVTSHLKTPDTENSTVNCYLIKF